MNDTPHCQLCGEHYGHEGHVCPVTTERHRTPYTVRQLRIVAQRNAIVKAALATWEHGGFESFEQCLIALAMHLTEQNERLVKDAVEQAKRHVHPFTIPEPGVWVNPVYDDSLRSMVRSRVPDPPDHSARLAELVEQWRTAIANGSEPIADEPHIVTGSPQ